MLPKWVKKYRGLFVIALWQATPTQYGLGFGKSSIDEVIVTGGGCEPESPPPVETFKRHKPASVGVAAQTYSGRNLRIGFGLAYNTGDTTSISGLQARGVFAGEWKYFGVGAGFVLDQAEPLPGVYLRAGPLNSLHLRLDMPDLSLPVSSTGVGRVGVAFNQSPEGGFGAFVGIPVCFTTCVYGAGGPRADIRVPIARGFEVTASGFIASDADDLDYWGAAVAGTIRR